MTALLLDGKSLAAEVIGDVRAEVAAFTARHGRPPSLHVVLAGDDAASAIYVRNKERAARDAGMRGEIVQLPATISEAALVDRVRALAEDDDVDGILVQLPLPRGLDDRRVLDLIPPEKDVDGFHPTNAGLLTIGRTGIVACTALANLRLIDEAIRRLASVGTHVSLSGADALVVGTSNIVGKPTALSLLAREATVTMAHSKTKNLAELCRRAEILVVAIGQPRMIRGDWIRPGAIVIDVGINRIEGADGKPRIVGDVAFDEACDRAAAITPVPGGVGPMTIAMLLQSTVRAARARLARR